MRFIAAVIFWMGLTGSVLAQWAGEGSASHTRIPTIDDADPAKLFAERLKHYKLHSGVAGLLKQSSGGGGFDLDRIRKTIEANPQLLEQAKEMLKGVDLSDPKYAGLIESVRRGNNWNVDPELMKQLLQSFQAGTIGVGNLSGMAIPRPQRSDPRGSSAFSDVNDETDSLRQKWARDIANWASRFPKDKLNGTLRESPALKKLVEEIAGAASRSNGGEGLDVQFARWQKRWEAFREWLPKDLPGVNLSGVNAPDFRLPNLNLSGGASRGASSVLGTAAELLPVLYVALGAVVVLLIVRMLRSRQKAADAAMAALGPWPVAPGRVENRQQLIRAFDYLAQKRCGPRAKSWHHRTVAQQMPRDETERAAAEELAGLYEWARYSPQTGEPTSQALDAARRQLSQLAEDAA